nr:YbaK/EbsC family protein [bacterium]
MSIELVRKAFARWGIEGRIQEFPVSSATVELAAAALGCEAARIAKTLSLEGDEGCILIVAAGDARLDNTRYKQVFHRKARMLPAEEVALRVGHAVGGVCPFGIPENIPVYLDESLRRFDTVFPACGSANSAIELTLAELEQYSGCTGWIDVCKGWGERA